MTHSKDSESVIMLSSLEGYSLQEANKLVESLLIVYVPCPDGSMCHYQLMRMSEYMGRVQQGQTWSQINTFLTSPATTSQPRCLPEGMARFDGETPMILYWPGWRTAGWQAWADTVGDFKIAVVVGGVPTGLLET